MSRKAEELPLVALSALRKQVAFMPEQSIFLLHLTSEAQVKAADWALQQLATELRQPWFHEGQFIWYTTFWAYATPNDNHLKVVELNASNDKIKKGNAAVNVLYRVMAIQHKQQAI